MDAFIISNWKDTNGQNARYVLAARHHGQEVIESFAIGSSDPAGVVGRFQLAAARYKGLSIRSAHRVVYDDFQYPTDIEWIPKNEPLIRTLMRQADVIHLNNSFQAMRRFGITRPMLLHHHGTLFRNDPAHMMNVARQRRMTQAVSTPDLMRPDPAILHWLPSAYDIDALQEIGRKNRRPPDGRVRIVHAPTQKGIYKNTDLFVSIVRELQKKHPIDLVLVEGRTNAECLVEKAKADLVYDQMMFGYGCNSIEAWGLGVPVIAGADPWTLNQMESMWGGLPFAEASVETLHDVVEAMVVSADMRAEYAAKGLAHVRRYHDEVPALERLVELYEMTIKGASRLQSKVDPVSFTADRDLSYRGEAIGIKDRTVEITDPVVISWLRGLAKRGVYGVVEG